MLELLDIRITFLLCTTHSNEEGKHPIVLRLTYRSERRDIFTGLYCEKEQWDKKNARLVRSDKKAGSANTNLDRIGKALEVFEH